MANALCPLKKKQIRQAYLVSGSIKKVAQTLQISRNTVRKLIRTEAPSFRKDEWRTLSAEVSGYEFYEADGNYQEKAYRLILVIPSERAYLGIRNAYRRSK